MKQRITYLRHNASDEFNPSHLTVDKSSLHIRSLDAAKEHRLTLGVSELPQELLDVLRQCQNVHIRWASPQPYQAVGPFVSRVSVGLHVMYTPRKREEEQQHTDSLCLFLKKVFDENMKCSTPADSFSSLPFLSSRFSSAATSQYHALVPSLAQLVMYIQQELCSVSNQACQAAAFELLGAKYLDFDFDAIAQELALSAYWDREFGVEGWSENISKREGESVEVGILNVEKADEGDREEIKLGGWLMVLGEDDKPKATLFSFPSRHHPLPSSQSSLTFHAAFNQPTGLHPILRITFHSAQSLLPPLPAAVSTCALHTYLTLPSALFIDRYQLSDPLFLASHNLSALQSLAGATDLEAPDWIIPTWGSAALLELALPSPDTENTDYLHSAQIPLHARYLQPASGGYANVSAAWPVVFWACSAEEGSKFPVSPFDRMNLGYEGLFGARTMFFHVSPTPEEFEVEMVDGAFGQGQLLVETMTLPVLDIDKSDWVEGSTVLAITGGFFWILWKLLGPAGNKKMLKRGVGHTQRRR